MYQKTRKQLQQSQIRPLLDSQVEAIRKLIKFKVGALFMQAGTGKTQAAYELIKSVGRLDYILWLTPFRTKESLRHELNKCGGLDCDIVGIETLSNSDRAYFKLYDRLEKTKNSFVVCDESLKIKNWEAKRTKRILRLGSMASFKLALNGTPLSRNILDLWAQMEFLSPKILEMGIAQFKNTFCRYTNIKKIIGRRVYEKEFITGHENIDYLWSLIHHYVYEADLKLRVAQNYIVRKYAIDEEAKEQYYLLKHRYLDREELLFKNNNIFLEMTQKMQHTYCITPSKLEILSNIVSVHGKDNVIVFCKYISSREEVTRVFNGLKVLSFSMHAFGLNLQQYTVTVFFDKIWDYAHRLQAELRTYRQGQKADCLYYDLTGDIGLEHIIDNNIKKKTNMLDYFKSKTIKELKKAL